MAILYVTCLLTLCAACSAQQPSFELAIQPLFFVGASANKSRHEAGEDYRHSDLLQDALQSGSSWSHLLDPPAWQNSITAVPNSIQ